MNLRDRAIAAYEAKIERDTHKAAEAEKQRRNAHVARLQALCVQILELPEIPLVQFVVGTNDATTDLRPVAVIEGLCFGCLEHASREGGDYLYLYWFAGKNLNGYPIYTLLGLGKALNETITLARIEGNRIVPAEGDRT